MPARKRTDVVMLLSNPATFDQRPLKEAHSLCASGRPVTILAWDRELETRTDTAFSDGLLVKRMRMKAGHGTPVLTVPRLMIFYLWSLAHLMTSPAASVHCHDVDTLPIGLAAKVLKLWRPRLVYDMHDLPEAFLRFFPLTKLTQAVFLASARKAADAILVVNERFVSYLGRLGFDRSKLVVIMNAPPESSGRGVKERGKEFNVLYYGWLGEERGVKLLLEAVAGLDGVTLTLAGRGELEPLVRAQSSRNSAVRFLGWLKMGDLDPVIRQADLIPSLYEPKTRNAIMATPGKLLTAMSISVPTLVPEDTYQAEIVTKYGCGLVVDWKDVSKVKGAIRDLASDRALYERMAEGAHRAFRSAFSWRVMETRLSECYDRLLGAAGE